jgi:tetratricopeptide (TPR) repeat protein
LRVDLDLVSTETGAHVWVDRYEVRHGDAGYGDAIPIQIVWAVNRAIIEADAARAARGEPDHPSAADLLLQARALLFRPKTLERQIELLALFRRVQQVDQNSAFAMAGEAEALLDSGVFQAEDPEYPARVRRAQELITRAEFLEPRNGKVLWARIFLLGSQDRCDELIPAVRRAIDDNPTLPLIRDGLHYRLGLCLMSSGRAADAISAFEQSIRDNPRNAQNYNRDLNIGYAQVFLGNYDEAVRWFRRSLVTNPDEGVWQRGNLLAAITSALALGGHSNEACATAAETMRLWPTLTARSYYRANRSNPVAIEQAERLRDGLRQAGIRDHADEAADFGLPADAVLRTEYEGHTPTTAPGAHTIGTREFAIMLEQKKPLVIDAAGAWGNSLPGAVGLRGVGVGGSTTDAYQDRLGNKMRLLTRGDTAAPIVVLGWNAERFPARNVALRLVALGYTDVYWYRGGREAWEAAGQSETELIVQDW